MIRRVVLPLNPIYAIGVGMKNAAYARGWARSRRLQWPVVSVGNISVGGSGKTPFVIAMVKLLTQRGVQVDVLSRGYKRSAGGTEKVDPTGDVGRFGDEPLLIAQAAGVPVYVGADRYEAGVLAENREDGPRVHLLDDGFQHRQLARQLDIVLVHRDDFSEALLPAGNLREPLPALRRASVIVLREEDAELEGKLRRLQMTAPVWYVRRVLDVPCIGKGVAFCGIARPVEFISSLQRGGMEVLDEFVFSDHHRYSEQDLKKLARAAREAGADFLITTEKDFVRLSDAQKKLLTEAVPVKVARLETQLMDEEAVFRKIQQAIGAGDCI